MIAATFVHLALEKEKVGLVRWLVLLAAHKWILKLLLELGVRARTRRGHHLIKFVSFGDCRVKERI